MALELTLLEICAQNQGNSVSEDLNVEISLRSMPPYPCRRDRLRRSIIIIRPLRNFCQLLEKLWTTLLLKKTRINRDPGLALISF